MSYTREDFFKDFTRIHLDWLTNEERMEGLSIKERMEGLSMKKGWKVFRLKKGWKVFRLKKGSKDFQKKSLRNLKSISKKERTTINNLTCYHHEPNNTTTRDK